MPILFNYRTKLQESFVFCQVGVALTYRSLFHSQSTLRRASSQPEAAGQSVDDVTDSNVQQIGLELLSLALTLFSTGTGCTVSERIVTSVSPASCRLS